MGFAFDPYVVLKDGKLMWKTDIQYNYNGLTTWKYRYEEMKLSDDEETLLRFLLPLSNELRYYQSYHGVNLEIEFKEDTDIQKMAETDKAIKALGFHFVKRHREMYEYYKHGAKIGSLKKRGE